MARPFWRLKQRSVAAISPHVWKLPLLVNLWLAVTAAALTTAVHKRTQYETSLVPFTAAVLVVLLCPLNLVWLKLAARYHKPSNATSQQSRPPPLDGGSRGPPKQKSRTVMVVRVCFSEKRSSPHCKVVRTVVCVLVILGVLFLLLLLAGDVERNPGPTVVTEDRVPELAALLDEVAAMWYLVLTQLGVNEGMLNQILAESAVRPNMSQHCLSRGLHLWVRSDESPTYEKIIAVLRGPVVTNRRLAREVEEFAQSVISAKVETMSSSGTPHERSPPAKEAAIRGEEPRHARSPPANSAALAFRSLFSLLVRAVDDPAGLADEFFAKGFISSDLLEAMSTLGVSKRDKTRKLLISLHARLDTNPSDFEAIASVLETSTAVTPGTGSMLRQAFPRLVASLEKGYVTIRSLKVVLTGAGGAGKTSTLNTLLDKPHLPYTSTGAATNAVRKVAAVSVGSVKGEDKWIRDSELLARVYASAEEKKETKKALNQDYRNGQPNEEFQTAPNGNPSSQEGRREIPASERETSDTKEKQINPKLKSIAEEIRRNTESLMRENTDASLKEFNVLHFLDSGGQVQFHEILHKFVGELNAGVFVSDLNHRPESKIEEQFFVEGKSLGKKYTTEYTHEQLLKRTLQALQQHSGSKIAIVATHLDDFKDLSKEKLSEQTKWIRDHVQNSSFNDGACILEKEADDFVFYLNASKYQSEDDKRIAKCLLEKLKEMFKNADELNIPIAHFALEQAMREYGNARKGIVTVTECEQMATIINREVPAEETLEFLQTRNLILQFKNIDALKNVVFCDVQTLLNIVTEIVRVSAVRRGECGSLDDIGSQFDTPQFKQNGVITEVDLNHKDFYEKCFKEIEDSFTPALFLTLMENIQIIGRISADSTASDATADPNPINSSGKKLVCEYIMPCILREMPEGDIVAYRMPADAEVAPLLLYFDKWPQSGVFCTLIAGLVSKQKWIPKTFQRKGEKKYLYRNCMMFEVSDAKCYVTLIESYHSGYFEVHIKNYDMQPLTAKCSAIREALYTVLESESLLIRDAVLCNFCEDGSPQDVSPHAAIISMGGYTVECTSLGILFPCTEAQKYRYMCWFDPPADCQEPHLDKTMEPRDVQKISKKVLTWQDLAGYLNFSDVDQQKIYDSRDKVDGRVAVIQEWQRKEGRKATFRALREVALKDMEDQELADHIEIIAKGQ